MYITDLSLMYPSIVSLILSSELFIPLRGLLIVLSTPVHFRLHAVWASVSSSGFSLCRAGSTQF